MHSQTSIFLKLGRQFHNSLRQNVIKQNPSLFLNHRALHVCRRPGLLTIVDQNSTRKFSTGQTNFQEFVKIEKADCNVYITNSTTVSSNIPDLSIPEPPPLPTSISSPEISDAVANVLTESGEPTLQSLGLGSWWPPGLIQQLLDLIHSTTGLPWYATIATATLIMRFLMFPVMVKSQKNAIHSRNTMPKLYRLQQEINEAKLSGDKYEIMRKTMKLSEHFKSSNSDPRKQILTSLVQAPVFISFFLGLKRMANVPVPSFAEGGILWFPNLTIPDPYYILPVITSVTVFITLRIALNVAAVPRHQNLVKMGTYAIPLILFPFCMNFPSAVLCYWTVNNFVTLAQVSLLKHQSVKDFLKFPKEIQHPPTDKPNSGALSEFKDMVKNIKNFKSPENLEKKTAVNFKKAGIGPIPRTYAYNPTKQHNRSYSTISYNGNYLYRAE